MFRLLKEPLLHFLAAGMCLFLLFEFAADDELSFDARTIEVNRDTLLEFMQFRGRAFDPGAAAARLDAMSADEVERLVYDYLREEALYREALALGLDKNDYVIKRRMVQSFEFISNGFVSAAVSVSDADVKAHFEANRQDYFVEPLVSFTHVFFRADGRNRDDLMSLARGKLAELRAQSVQFSDAPRHGDRFPYFVNYVERTIDVVTSHFGRQMAEAIFALDARDSTWQGPFESPHGVHLVLLSRKETGRYPGLAEVEDRVRRDAERAKIAELQARAIRAIVDSYDVRRNLGSRSSGGAP